MTLIVCLANAVAPQPGRRCVAGMVLSEDDCRGVAWVRLLNSRVTNDERFFDEKDVANFGPLDVVDVDFDLDDKEGATAFQPENRIVKNGIWRYVSTLTRGQIECLCERDTPILHSTTGKVNRDKLVDWEYRSHRKSLSLVRPNWLKFAYDGFHKRWNAEFADRANNTYRLSITDPRATARLDQERGDVTTNCLLTVSLTPPFGERRNCYKIVAAVIW